MASRRRGGSRRTAWAAPRGGDVRRGLRRESFRPEPEGGRPGPAPAVSAPAPGLGLSPGYRITCRSTKTIAVDSRVYDRLAGVKLEGESFSKTIDRLLRDAGAAHTGAEILRALEDVVPLTDADADVMLSVVEESRASEAWERRGLR